MCAHSRSSVQVWVRSFLARSTLLLCSRREPFNMAKYKRHMWRLQTDPVIIAPDIRPVCSQFPRWVGSPIVRIHPSLEPAALNLALDKLYTLVCVFHEYSTACCWNLAFDIGALSVLIVRGVEPGVTRTCSGVYKAHILVLCPYVFVAGHTKHTHFRPSGNFNACSSYLNSSSAIHPTNRFI